jgi:hypothetical protein
MATTWLQLDLIGVCVLGVSAALLGVCGLLCGGGRKGRARHAPAALAVLLAGAGVAAAALGQPRSLWLPPLAVAGAWAALAALRQPLVGRALQGLAGTCRHRQAQALLLLVLGPALIFWRVEEADRASPPFDPASLSTGDKVLDLEYIDTRWAATDTGRPLRLAAARPGQEVTDEVTQAAEVEYFKAHSFAHHVIRTGPAGDGTNCHGWVFTGGRHWISGKEVETILADNGYREVQAPQPGDLAVFRESGAVIHSGVVCGLSEEGTVLIESKWGRLGRFVHTAEQHCYLGSDLTYYHTPRGGHLLRGVSGSGHDQETPGSAVAKRPPQPQPQPLAE